MTPPPLVDHAHIFEVALLGAFGCLHVGRNGKRCQASIPIRPVLAQEHSETSKAAARAVAPGSRHAGRVAVLDALRRRGAHGGTDDELAKDTGLEGSTGRPRRVALCDDGLAVAHCAHCGGEITLALTRVKDWSCPACRSTDLRTRRTRSGRSAVVWTVANLQEKLYSSVHNLRPEKPSKIANGG